MSGFIAGQAVGLQDVVGQLQIAHFGCMFLHGSFAPCWGVQNCVIKDVLQSIQMLDLQAIRRYGAHTGAEASFLKS